VGFLTDVCIYVKRQNLHWRKSICGCYKPQQQPTLEERVIVLVATPTLRKAERLIESCEHCNPEGMARILSLPLTVASDLDAIVFQLSANED